MAEERRVGHRGGEGARGEHTDAEHFAHSARRFIVARMRSDLGIAALDARMQGRELLARFQQQRAHRKRYRSSLFRPGSTLTALAGLRDRDAELGRRPPQAIDQRRALLIEAGASRPDRIVCCSTVLIGAKRMVGWRAAIAMAVASLPSFLPPWRNGAATRRRCRTCGVTAGGEVRPPWCALPQLPRRPQCDIDSAAADKFEASAAQDLALEHCTAGIEDADGKTLPSPGRCQR